MARKTVGKVVQRESDAALYAGIAARLEGVRTHELDDYFREQLRLRLGHNAAEKRIAALRGGASPDPLKKWTLVDEPQVGLARALLHFPSDGTPQPTLYSRLEGLPGIRQVFEGSHKRDLWAIALLRSPEDRGRLRATLAESTERVIWEEVERESWESSLATWRYFAREAARTEGLALD